jgi:tRNA-5-methyluridine54 2-sulfurtransferase
MVTPLSRVIITRWVIDEIIQPIINSTPDLQFSDGFSKPEEQTDMRCRFCGEKAVVNMRHHKLALCKAHFLDWVPARIERSIKRYRMFTQQDRLLVAVSGGKDSLSLWDILHRLGYAADGLYIGLGIDEGLNYSVNSLACADAFAREHGLELHIIDIKTEYGESVPEVAAQTHRGRNKPCSVCGLIKRYVMNQVALKYGYAALVTGHNLDDEASTLFGNTLSWSGSYLLSQGPVLEADRQGFIRKVKPLCRMYEREMASYAFLRGIEYIQDECPFAFDSTSIYYKEILSKLETDRPGTKLNFYLAFLQAKKNGVFSTIKDDRHELLHACPKCGQPTSAPGLCSFCRMFDKTRSMQVPNNIEEQ